MNDWILIERPRINGLIIKQKNQDSENSETKLSFEEYIY